MRFVIVVSSIVIGTAVIFGTCLYYFYSKLEVNHKSSGNASQIVSAFGSMLFGLASIITALSIYLLQDQSRLDNEMGRTTDVLLKFEQNKTSNFDDYVHSGACMAYLAKLFKEPDFDNILVLPESDRRFTQRLFARELIDRQTELKERSECLASELSVRNDEKVDHFAKFYRRLILSLNNYESVLFDWDRYSEDLPKDLIRDQVVQQICQGPTKNLFPREDTHPAYKKVIVGAYPQLSNFVSQCDSLLDDAAQRSLDRRSSLAR